MITHAHKCTIRMLVSLHADSCDSRYANVVRANGETEDDSCDVAEQCEAAVSLLCPYRKDTTADATTNDQLFCICYGTCY